MADIVELERRITAALGRIAAGLDRREAAAATAASEAGASGADGGDATALQAELAEERLINAQLTEKLRQMNATAAVDPAATDALEERIAALQGQLDQQGLEMMRLRKTSASLREELEALRAANPVDAHLLNRAMLAELEALRAERMAETAELAAIVDALAPIVAPMNEEG